MEQGDYKFQYHGAACRLEKHGVICEYDLLPENEYPVKFSNWELNEFINTSEKWKTVKYSLEELHEILLQLVEDKKASSFGDRVYNIFCLSNKRYECI
ncbi:DUF6896 domain-containing protein [Sphingobacterium tabacisoli]|uniref:DUF6896 domain-containing protein n=1 Tax=Sphingobacterium tabacisoli TaxID=2044855 RepID=A0ABW5L8T0_9SPHI|nr:hypothetical protein [Sphingobacterium tabacisoli]